MWRYFHKWGSPKYFYQMSGQWMPWLGGLAALAFAYGLIGGLLLAPPDYQQGDSFRIIYIHVPSAFLSLSVYTTMAIAAAIGLIWHMKLADMVAISCAPIGAVFTAVALLTGAIWGKPMWGTWWEWDARLTSELILLFLYLGYMALYHAYDDKTKGARASAWLVIVGIINVPIIHFSVEWWNTLHQGATLSKFEKPSIDIEMLKPLLSMIAAFFFYFIYVMMQRTRCEILSRERNSHWIKQMVSE